jgi:DNA-binding NarL/FixJ family response regulator
MPKAASAPALKPEPQVTVLSVGHPGPYFTQRNYLLAKAGLAVVKATTAEEAIQAARSTHPRTVVIGHRVPPAERLDILRGIRRIDSTVKAILFYDQKIDSAEMADAILNVHGDPRDLIRTIHYLLSKPVARKSRRTT